MLHSVKSFFSGFLKRYGVTLATLYVISALALFAPMPPWALPRMTPDEVMHFLGAVTVVFLIMWYGQLQGRREQARGDVPQENILP